MSPRSASPDPAGHGSGHAPGHHTGHHTDHPTHPHTARHAHVAAGEVHGHLLTPGGWLRGRLHWGADGRISAIDGEPVSEPEVRHGRLPLVLPGFVDLHVHGGGGRDTMEAGDALPTIARTHARHGTTALLATTMTAPPDELQAAMAAMGPACQQRQPGMARVLGVHLEGPYINPGRLGAQPDHARPASTDELQRLHALAPIRLITLAPEIPGNLEWIARLRAAGFVVQIGHSAGSYEDGVAALRQGAAGFTHLFNAMSGLHHRAPGMVGAALAHATHAEIIPDLLHVHPGAIRAALRAIPCLYCVSDSTAATGMPDGEYQLGSHRVRKCLGGVRLEDGTLAGSTLTLDQALRNLVFELGLEIDEASRRVSTHAADFIGAADRGRLAPGAWADLVVLDTALQLQRVLVEGETIES
ncbi:N-acetylglucosamine-6-phosphate deacetylase [Aquabacterium sp. OR-4]|uniref:N-acetylglucosamine-6-phosphate deacetylase n=1 Tax=Aquabacterium sp. OR-4 TaxID=2978127 RepID=UPI0021B40867|nr:N-acetylglucosamine-6-phosphate deacetylase [Aquabacterium sp. OR-4]MDT7836603.1 N-acetylglucosamine-6-phosphate deacetylase [Aquabacterium sp. OR-4]